MKEDKPSMVIEQEEIALSYEMGDIDDCYIGDAFNLILGNEIITIEGSVGLWSGRREIMPTLLDYENASGVLSRLQPEGNTTISIYKNKIEVIDGGHDGINYYTLKRFSWDNLTIKELQNVIINDGLWNDFKEYWDEVKSKDIRKYHYTEFIDNIYESDTFDVSEPE